MIILLNILQLLCVPGGSGSHNHRGGSHHRAAADSHHNNTPSATQSPSLPGAGRLAGADAGDGSAYNELLSKMGLPGPPRGDQSAGERERGRSQVPSFLLEMFRQQERTMSTGLSSVSSFPALPLHGREEGQKVQFRFDIEELLNSEDIARAQLRAFKVKGSRTKESPYRVSVFHVVGDGELAGSGERRHYLQNPFNSSTAIRLLDSQILESRQAHWVTFDVTKAVQLSQELHLATVSLEVSYTPVNPIEVAASSRGIRFTRSRGRPPSLVVYTEKPYPSPEDDDDRDTRNSVPFDDSTTYDVAATYCQKRELWIDFSSLGWNWIIAPRGFDAFMCTGDCGLPTVVSMKSKITNHAYLQAVMGSKHSSIPEPCCSPTKLKNMTLLYLYGSGYKLKSYEQMVVESCGCE
uniref:TGF_beta domain-containing protein n=3 Tax=Hormiphora californensis TaxID=1403702 RepID=V9PPS1_HORCA|nr:TGF_beta domain-containing protein [Hormiphora californensis]